MSKELKVLENLKNMLIGNGVNDNINEYIDNLILPIKKSLQRLEAIDNANPSEALEETLRDIAYDLVNDDNPFLRDRYYGLLDVKQALITKSKKELAFEIIKEKKIDVNQFQTSLIVMGSFTYRYYINHSEDYHTAIMVKLLEEDEFNTLKEVL